MVFTLDPSNRVIKRLWCSMNSVDLDLQDDEGPCYFIPGILVWRGVYCFSICLYKHLFVLP